MYNQGIHDEDVADIVRRLAVEGARAGAHQLFGEIHGAESPSSSRGSRGSRGGVIRNLRSAIDRTRERYERVGEVERLSTVWKNRGASIHGQETEGLTSWRQRETDFGQVKLSDRKFH